MEMTRQKIEYVVGRLYLVRGRIMRYQGPWGEDSYAELKPGHCCSFLVASNEPRVSSPAVGYSDAQDSEQTRPMTTADLSWLTSRLNQERARNLPTEDTEVAIAELEAEEKAAKEKKEAECSGNSSPT